MGLADEIKKAAEGNGTKIQSTESALLEKILNKTFFLDKNVEEETKFVKQVMTRGMESQERVGLHASALIVSDKAFCVRQQVLSLLYRQRQREQVPVGLMRIFEEGNAIHEKWQRLFIRAGFSVSEQLDLTKVYDDYEVSNTPDIICTIPEFNDKTGYDGEMIGEIKSVNTFQFKKMIHHPSAGKQLQWYMYLRGIEKGFVLCEDKNTQEVKVMVYDYDPEVVAPFIARCEEIQYYKNKVFEEGKMVKRASDCKTSSCKRATDCAMRDACFGVGMGRQRLGE